MRGLILKLSDKVTLTIILFPVSTNLIQLHYSGVARHTARAVTGTAYRRPARPAVPRGRAVAAALHAACRWRRGSRDVVTTRGSRCRDCPRCSSSPSRIQSRIRIRSPRRPTRHGDRWRWTARPGCPGLTTLSVHGNSIGAEGAAALAAGCSGRPDHAVCGVELDRGRGGGGTGRGLPRPDHAECAGEEVGWEMSLVGCRSSFERRTLYW